MPPTVTKAHQEERENQRSAHSEPLVSQIPSLNYQTVPNTYRRHHEDHYDNLTKNQTANMNNFGNVFKLFREQHKYNGQTDFLDQRLRVFYDICETFCVPKQQFSCVFPAMLTGAAHEYYYDQIAGQGFGFGEVCNKMKLHFEIEERRYEMLNEWHNISLVTQIRKHPELSILACFEGLVSELQRIRRGLDIEYQTDKSMRDRLQLACRDVEACCTATLKPAATFEGLCSDIRLSISANSRVTANSTNALLMHRELAYHNSSPSHVFYTDRRYHTPNLRPEISKAQTPRNGQYEWKSRDNGRIKKCFVCLKGV